MKLLPFLFLLSCAYPVETIEPCSHYFAFIDPEHLDIEINSELPEVDLSITESDGNRINLTVQKRFYKCLTVGVESGELTVEVWSESYCRTDLK